MNKMIKKLINVHKQESILSKKLKKLKEDVRDYMQKNNLSFITNEDGEVVEVVKGDTQQLNEKIKDAVYSNDWIDLGSGVS